MSDQAGPPIAPGEVPADLVSGAAEGGDPAPRRLVILAWATGPAALYALLGLLHAALVERILTIDVGFGRSLAFWVGTLYLALLLWGLLPPRPAGWYARRGTVRGVGILGILGALVCGSFTTAWLATRWNASVGGPVLVSLAILAAAAGLTLWYADRESGQ